MKIIQRGGFAKMCFNNTKINDYILSKYVIYESIDDFYIFFSTKTGCCVILEENEIYTHMPFLVNNGFYVDKHINELIDINKIKNLKSRKFKNNVIETISNYTISTTSKCNANCWYCIENIKTKIHMSDDIAVNTAQFIIEEYKNNSTDVYIKWFGGEPLYNEQPINIICQALCENNIPFISEMATNGYLLDANKILTYINIWKLKKVQITLDGINSYYNDIKQYIYTEDKNPFNTIVNNIKVLLDNDIKVSIRLNVSLENKEELIRTVDFLYENFKNYKTLNIYCSPLFQYLSENSEDIVNIVLDINTYIFKKFKLIKTIKFLPKTFLQLCPMINNSYVAINPFGNLTLCDFNLDDDSIGDVKNGITKYENIANYKKQVYVKDLCEACILYPMCYKLQQCPTSNSCNTNVIKYHIEKIKYYIRFILNKYIEEKKNGIV